MATVTLRNTLDVQVKVQEGNAGVYADTAELAALTGTFALTVNPNATYREYILIILPDGTKVDPSFSSDDAADFEEIVIKKEDGKVVWEGIRRDDAKNPVFKLLKGIFRWR
jgi:hypothetical protein